MAPPVRAGLRGHRDAWRAFGAFRPEFSLPLCGGVFTLGPSGLKLSLSVRPPGSLSELEAGSASSAPTAPPARYVVHKNVLMQRVRSVSFHAQPVESGNPPRRGKRAVTRAPGASFAQIQ